MVVVRRLCAGRVQAGDTVGVLLDMDKGTISFFKERKYLVSVFRYGSRLQETVTTYEECPLCRVGVGSGSKATIRGCNICPVRPIEPSTRAPFMEQVDTAFVAPLETAGRDDACGRSADRVYET